MKALGSQVRGNGLEGEVLAHGARAEGVSTQVMVLSPGRQNGVLQDGTPNFSRL